MRTSTWRIQTRQHRDERGAIIIMVCIAMILMIVSVAMVVDVGNARRTRSQSQHAVDAAVLAAINVAGQTFEATGTYDWEKASTVAKQMLSQNLNISTTEWPGCTDPKHTVQFIRAPSDIAAGNECISFQLDGGMIDARVKMPTQEVDTVFGGVVGMDSIQVNASAGADGAPGVCDPSDPGGCVSGQPPTSGTTTEEWCTIMVDEFSYHLFYWDLCSPYRGGDHPGFLDTACELGEVSYWNPLTGSVQSFVMTEWLIYIFYWQVCEPYADGVGSGDRDAWLGTFCLALTPADYYLNNNNFQACLPILGGDREAWLSTSSSTSSVSSSSSSSTPTPTTIRLTN